jgi:bacterial/archaeal transporter family protein
VFLIISGVATGISWLAYFRALQLGPASRIAPVDKLSLALTLELAALFLLETVKWKVAVGVALMSQALCLDRRLIATSGAANPRWGQSRS